MERSNSDDIRELRRISRDRLVEMRVKFILDPFYPLSVIRLHSQNQSPSFHVASYTHRRCHQNYGIRYIHYEGTCTLYLCAE